MGTQEESTKVVVGLEKSNLNNQEVADSMKQQRKRKSLSKKTATEVQLVLWGVGSSFCYTNMVDLDLFCVASGWSCSVYFMSSKFSVASIIF